LDTLQIEAKAKELEKWRQRSSHFMYRTQVENIKRDLNTVKNRCMRLKQYTTLLCAWLLTCLGEDESLPDPLLWEPGDFMPEVPKALAQNEPTGPKFEIPRELCCHISSEIMNDPVKTVDGFTYEGKNIERWWVEIFTSMNWMLVSWIIADSHRFQTNEKSPLTNLVLDSLDLLPDLQKKEEIATFLSASDITSKYKALRGDAHLIRVSLKSPLNTWSLMLPRNLKLAELWEVASRLTKGRYSSFELQHRNIRLSPNQSMISSSLHPDHTVFITPTGSNAARSGLHGTEGLCLVKVFDASFRNTVVSYWEPKNSARSIRSTIFRYYRANFTASLRTSVEEPFTLWTGLRDVGDGQLHGTVIGGPWERLSLYFNTRSATGTLEDESCIDKSEEDSVRRQPGHTQPLVFKLALGRAPSSNKKERNFLSRLDVLKQMFDAFINRLLAYNFQTHIGLVTFGTKATVSQASPMRSRTSVTISTAWRPLEIQPFGTALHLLKTNSRTTPRSSWRPRCGSSVSRTERTTSLGNLWLM
jgi:hypothetical protein